jgi:hypothetical protein
MTTLETTMHRALLKSAIMRHRTFFCPISDKELDIRKSVLFIVSTPEGKTQAEVIDGSAWDERKSAMINMVLRNGWKMESYDGRLLSSSSETKQAEGYQEYEGSTVR